MRLWSGHVLRILAWATLLTGLFSVTPSIAQTSPEQCALDSLVLLSPEENGLSVRLSTEGDRFGTYIHWNDLPDEATTCATIRQQNLPIDIQLSGTYTDFIDRELEFFILQSGDVGSTEKNRLLLGWFNVYVSRSGAVEGEINLSNNGGVLYYDRATQIWSPINTGLPQYLPFTDIIALAQSRQESGHYILHLSSQGLPDPTGRTRGLWEKKSGQDWARIASDLFPDGMVLTKLAFSPDNDSAFAVGTKRNGLFLTSDGGASFQQFTNNLDPSTAPPENFDVTAITWNTGGTIYVSIRAFGLFVSRDNGATWNHLGNLLVRQDLQNPLSPLVFPVVNQILVDPTNSDNVYTTLRNYALYYYDNNTQNWSARTGDWIDPTDDNWRHNGIAVDVHAVDNQVILVGTSQKGIWRTADGGATWLRVADDIYDQNISVNRPVRNLFFDSSVANGVYCFVDKIGILYSTDLGQNWVVSAPELQPTNLTGREFHSSSTDDGDVIVASYAGGIYTPGTVVPISNTIVNTSLPGLELGLNISFGPGHIDSGLTYHVVCQDFQGYAVWRSDSSDPLDLQLIGLYDKTNPETCIEGFCGDPSFNILPNCFNEKRAACFDFNPSGGGIEFFDDSVSNGFTYYYAVTTFDYLNTASVEPTALAQPILFSPRYPSALTDSLRGLPNPDPSCVEPKDPDSPFWSCGNLIPFQVNTQAQSETGGFEIYVFPNPLRNDVGFSGQEGQRVRFTNLPPESRIQVFSEDGDLIADLGPELQIGGNIDWVTVNTNNEILASGIYIWRVQMPERGDFWGRLVIIR